MANNKKFRVKNGLISPDADITGALTANSVSSNNLSVAGITYPITDGANGQVMTTNGSGSLSFSTVNATTDLSTSANSTTRTVTSSSGTDAVLPSANSTQAGVMSSANRDKLDGIAAGAQVNIATNLGTSANTTARTVTSSSGTDAVLPSANSTQAGVMSSTDKTKLDDLEGGEFTLTSPNGTIRSSAAGGGGTGTRNFFVGPNAGRCNTTGENNNFIGEGAGRYVTTGSHNNFFGLCAGQVDPFKALIYGCRNTGSRNNFFGCRAGYNNTTGGNNNFFGARAGFENISGCSNNFLGNSAGQCNTTGSNNNFFGVSTGVFNTTGRNNHFFGALAGRSNTTGCNNIAIGHFSGTTFSQPSGLFELTTTSNRIIMGNADHVCAQIQIGWTTVSDVRDKCIYGSIDRGLGFLKGLNPIEYQFKDRENDEITDPIKKRRYGFSAQEILELEGDHPVIVSTEDPNRLQVTTDHLLPIMVNAIKELSAKCEALEERVAILEQ